MISVLFLSLLSLTLSYNTAICDIESYLDLGFNEDIIDHTKIGNSTDLILTTKNILLLDQDLNVLSSITSPSNGSYKCDKVVSHQTLNYFFVACQSEGSAPYFAAFQVNGTSITTFGLYNYLQTLEEPIPKVKLIGNTLLVEQSNKILFYTLVIQATQWYIRTTSYVLDKQFFERTTLNITDFDASPFTQDLQQYYRIFIVEYNDGILWVDAISRTNNLIPFNSGNLNLKNSFYISFNARFRGAAIAKATYNSTRFVIQTYDEGSYHFSATFLSSSTSVSLYQYAFLNKYKDWTPISSLRYENNVLALSYQNYQKTVVTNLFDIYVYEQENKVNQEPTDILISASVDRFILYFISDKRVVFRSDYDSLSRCSLSNYDQE